LVSGDMTIDGTINLNGENGGPFNNGSPGIGGPGGFNGGRGGLYSYTGASQGGDGQGPGAGKGAPNGTSRSGGGGSFGSSGNNGTAINGQGLAGVTYGNVTLLPLIGGSGGGGATGGQSSSNFNSGPGGGGGGGAILIAVTGTVTINGTITARGGSAGTTSISGQAGSGSGGAIRIIATTIAGEGAITAQTNNAGIDGGHGRIRLEAENMFRASATIPNYTFSSPSIVLIPNLPVLRISSVDGINSPAVPTGNRDIELPGITSNPVTVEFVTTNVPLGTIISLTAAPERGTAVTANSTPVSGSANAGTASASINLPNGNSILSAQTTFTVTASLGKDFSKYAQGEQVEKVRVGINLEGRPETTFVTISGKEFTFPSDAIAMY
jgi:hypothetical protein